MYNLLNTRYSIILYYYSGCGKSRKRASLGPAEGPPILATNMKKNFIKPKIKIKTTIIVEIYRKSSINFPELILSVKLVELLRG